MRLNASAIISINCKLNHKRNDRCFINVEIKHQLSGPFLAEKAENNKNFSLCFSYSNMKIRFDMMAGCEYYCYCKVVDELPFGSSYLLTLRFQQRGDQTYILQI